MALVHDDDLARIHETWDNVVTKPTLAGFLSHNIYGHRDSELSVQMP